MIFGGRVKMRLAYHIILAPAVLSAVLLAQPASAKCVSRPVALKNGATETVMAVVPDGGSGDLEAAGFKDTSCGNLDKAAYLRKSVIPRAGAIAAFSASLRFGPGFLSRSYAPQRARKPACPI